MIVRIFVEPNGLSDVPFIGPQFSSEVSLRQRAWNAIRADQNSCLLEGGGFGMKTMLLVDNDRGLLYRTLADCTVADVERFCNLHELRDVVSSFELEDQPALDHKAVKPYRGEYSFGQRTKAIVDSFVGEGGWLVFKIQITGQNISSMFDLYREIRTGKAKPDKDKAWDHTVVVI